MGYQVGNTCYADLKLAENVYFSQVSPIITEQGIEQLRFTGSHWEFKGSIVRASLPECSPLANYQAGYELGMALLPMAVFLFGIKIIARLLNWR